MLLDSVFHLYRQIVMPHFTRSQRRRWSLPLVVVLLLHWTFGVCSAMAEVLCFEPGGKVVVELSGEPCGTAQLEQKTGEPCFDLQLDSHDEHATLLPHAPQLADLQPALFVLTLPYPFPAPQAISLTLPAATGPPPSTDSVILRRTTVLLI